MKRMTFSIAMLLLSSLPAWTANALTFEIAASKTDVISFEVPVPGMNTTVGELTVETLKSHNIPFQGGEVGISSIRGITGEYETVGPGSFKAWGWCFAIDGVISDELPGDTIVSPNAKLLKWFYAYALYEAGAWTKYCAQD